jgi:hypothetical protein
MDKTLFEWLSDPDGSDTDVIVIEGVVYSRAEARKFIDLPSATDAKLHGLGV